MGSSRTRARTLVPCIGRQIFNHCTTREAQGWGLCPLSGSGNPSLPPQTLSSLSSLQTKSPFDLYHCLGTYMPNFLGNKNKTLSKHLESTYYVLGTVLKGVDWGVMSLYPPDSLPSRNIC